MTEEERKDGEAASASRTQIANENKMLKPGGGGGTVMGELVLVAVHGLRGARTAALARRKHGARKRKRTPIFASEAVLF